MGEDELQVRLRALEVKLSDMSIQLVQVVTILDHMADHERRLRDLERSSENNRMAISAMKWLTAAVVTSALGVMGASFVEIVIK